MGVHLHLRPPQSTLRQIELGVFIVILVVVALRVWFQPPPALQQLLFREELQVALVENPLGRSELAETNAHDQLELDLLHGFADTLGTRIRVIRVETPHAALERVRDRRVDIAAGFLLDPDDPRIESGPRILSIKHVIAYWRDNGDNGPLESLEALPAGARLGITEQASLPEKLRQRRVPPAGETRAASSNGRPQPRPPADQTIPARLVPYGTTEALRQALKAGEIDYAVMNSLEFGRLRRLYPQLRTAFRFERSTEVEWLFPAGLDRSLIERAEEYVQRLRDNGELEVMIDRYLGHLQVHDLVDALTFARQVGDRLDRYRPIFEEAGAKYGLDWRFIAAVAYQESHWDAEAVSSTGVRGLMMLTRDTAADLNISNRTDPAASVDGGTRYLLQMRARLPERIPEPDRTWMALAAYNVGLGHLHDARRLADANGDDPDRWLDVKEWLPRLAEPKWHEQTRYGYARGREPVTYVQNIRSYYDKLIQRYPEASDRRSTEPRPYRRTPWAL